jgi:hypothetical protein
MALPFFKVSNRGTQKLDNSKKRKIRREIGFDSVDGELLQIKWN